jgi:diaminohydroxyphosphoribosylaminopyrimidine deaminase/5-amino-6-(5-phosphoribosylamino)uracil reductase
MYESLMRRCLELALKAHGRTAPNPLVGAVVVDDNGEVIAEGYHRRRGEPHAEVHALKEAGERARGQTLYVNLEPCCHFGKTPPCTDAVIASGVKRVVAGMTDPNPKVAGGGIAALRKAGIEVVSDVLESECRWLNRGFCTRIGSNRPWVHLKMAVTLDGRIADREGQSRWITGPEARAYVHKLRNTSDVVIIGGATAAIDDPELTVREIAGGRDPLRVVIDTQLRLPPRRRLFDTGRSAVFTAIDKVPEESIFGASTKIVGMPSSESGEGIDLKAVLERLAEDGANEVLCEGGGRLAAAFLEADLVDEVHWFVAPVLLIDKEAKPSLSGRQPRKIGQALTLVKSETRAMGNDTLIHGLLRPFN